MRRVCINNVWVDSVEGVDVHLGQRLRIKRPNGFEEIYRVEAVTAEGIWLQPNDPSMDFATRVEAGLWGGI